MLSSFPRTVQKRRVHGIPYIFNIPLCLPVGNLKLFRQSSGVRISVLHNSVVEPNYSLISRNKNTSPVEFVHAFIQNALHELQRATQWLSVNMCHPASSVLSYYDLRLCFQKSLGQTMIFPDQIQQFFGCRGRRCSSGLPGFNCAGRNTQHGCEATLRHVQ